MDSGVVQETPTDTKPGKLTPELQDQVCRRLAAFESGVDIIAWLEAEHGIALDKSTITYYRTSDAWADKHQRYRAEWQAGTKDLYDLANVSGRVRELRKLYVDAYKDYTKATSSDKRASRAHCAVLLEQIQSELPGAMIAGEGATLTIELPEWYQDRQPETVPAGNK